MVDIRIHNMPVRLLPEMHWPAQGGMSRRDAVLKTLTTGKEPLTSYPNLIVGFMETPTTIGSLKPYSSFLVRLGGQTWFTRKEVSWGVRQSKLIQGWHHAPEILDANIGKVVVLAGSDLVKQAKLSGLSLFAVVNFVIALVSPAPSLETQIDAARKLARRWKCNVILAGKTQVEYMDAEGVEL